MPARDVRSRRTHLSFRRPHVGPLRAPDSGLGSLVAALRPRPGRNVLVPPVRLNRVVAGSPQSAQGSARRFHRSLLTARPADAADRSAHCLDRSRVLAPLPPPLVPSALICRIEMPLFCPFSLHV